MMTNNDFEAKQIAIVFLQAKEKCECQPKSEPLAHEFLSHSCS